MTEVKTQIGRIAAIALTAGRLWLGAWMLINGLNHWFEIFPQPLGRVPQASALLVIMIESGLFDYAKAIEIVGGLMLITGRFIPLALAMLLPVSAIVFYSGGIISGGLDRLFYMGTHAFYLNVILLLAYIRYYLPMMTFHSDMGTLDDLKKLPTIFKPEARNPKLPS